MTTVQQTVQQVVDFLDSIAPFALAQPWDNPGLLVGDGAAQVTGILTAMDATLPVIEEAEKLGCNLVVCHHPVIFDPIKSVLAGSIPYEAARRGIAIVAAHTNLDLAPGGVNDALAAALGLVDLQPLSTADPFGLRGRLPEPVTPQELAAQLHQRLGLHPHYNPLGRDILWVGLCGGSGGEMLEQAAAEGVYLDAFVTADVKHHQFLAAAAQGTTLYSAGHHATEAPVLPVLTEQLAKQFCGLRVAQCKEYDGYLVC